MEYRKPFARFYRGLFGIAHDNVRADRRGFRVTDEGTRERLESIGDAFLKGYHAALQFDPLALEVHAADIRREFHGFYYEGAGMATTLLECLFPWKKGAFKALFEVHGDGYRYTLIIGVGWARARLPALFAKRAQSISDFDPILRWLVADGWGFHQGYFHWPEHIERQRVPRSMGGYGRRAFDQGLGRSLWFVEGGDAARITGRIGRFSPARRADLWSGIGLACAYAGGSDVDAAVAVLEGGRDFAAHLAQGCAFAAKARQRAGNPTPYTERACRIFCDLSLEEAAAVTDTALRGVDDQPGRPAYEEWRRRIREAVAVKVT